MISGSAVLNNKGRPLLLTSGVLFWLLVFFLAPLFLVFLCSFARRGPYGEIEWGFGLWNYARALEPLYLKIYLRSFAIAGITTVICLLLAYPAAYYVALVAEPRRRNLLILLLVLPFWTSFLVRNYAWILLLRSEGLINRALLALGLVGEPLPLLYSNFAVVLGLVYSELPFMVLPIYAVLQRLDKSLFEAAGDLGASSFQTFLKVVLPLSLPGVMAGVVFVFIPSLGAFITPDLLGGARSMMVGNLVQNQFAVVRDAPFGSAVAFTLAALVLALLSLARRAIGVGPGEMRAGA